MKHKRLWSVILVFVMLISLFASPAGYAADAAFWGKASRLAGENSAPVKDSAAISIQKLEIYESTNFEGNMAQGKRVKSSGLECPGQWTEDKAVDGDYTTTDSRWSGTAMKSNATTVDSNEHAPVWFFIDLGVSPVRTDSITIRWYKKVWATEYEILTSDKNTDETWAEAAKTPVITTERPSNGSVDIVDTYNASDFLNGNTNLKRYVRFNLKKLNTSAAGHSPSIKEIEILGMQPLVSSTSADAILKAITQLQLDNTHVVLPQVPEGYKIAVVGSDVENVITNDGTRLQHAIGKRNVPLLIEVKSEENPSDMARKNITVTAPTQIANYPQEWFPKVNNPNTKPTVIPSIQEWYGYKGYFTLTSRSKIIVNDAAGVNLKKAAQNMQENLSEICGFSPEIKEGTAPSAGNIYLESLATDKYDTGKEGYVLVANKDGVQIYSSTYTGGLYGTVTAEQILWQAKNHASIPNGIIRDYPKYEIRGMMLDVARIPHRLQYLKDYEKILQWYKMNEFHLHLNDDFDYNPDTASPAHSEWTSWTGTHRILSDMFPGLHTVTYPGQKFEYYNKIYGEPYYSKQDFRDLTSKGRDAGINVIAEFDTPSHATAYARYALQNPDNVDWLGAGKEIDTGGSNQMLTLDINSANADEKANAGRARKFISQLYDDYLGGDDPVFTNDTMHVGADEYWSTKNREAFRDYSAFLTGLAKKYGKTVRMWGAQKKFYGTTEIPKDTVLDVWATYEENPIARMKEGYRVVNVPQPFLYVTPGRWHKDMINEEFVFRTWDPTIFNAADKTIALKGEPLLLGAKTAMWGDEHKEGIVEADMHERALRAVAITSEKTWGGTKDNDSYLDYQQKFSRLREGPGTQIAMTIKSESEVVVDYDFAKAKTETGKLCIPDQSGNGYNAEVMGGTLVKADGTTYIKFDGSTLMTTPLKTLRYPYTVSFDLKMDSAQQKNRDSSLFSGYDGRLQAVGVDGALSLNRSFYTQSFGYKVPEGQKVNITLVGRAGSTRLFVDGKFVKLLSRDDDKDNDTGYFTTFVLPLEEIGKNFTGYIGNIKAYNQAFSSDLVAADGTAVTEVNTALNRNAYADNVIAPKERDTKKTPIWKSVDGDYDDPGAPMEFRSGWQSAGTADDALIVDLGQPRKISRVFLNWASDGAASDFSIMVSDDCLQWTLADTVTGNASTASNVKLKEPVKARYVKMQGVAFAPENTLKKYYIREMQVYENVDKSALKLSIQLAQSAVNNGVGGEKLWNALTRAHAALYNPAAPQAEIDASERSLCTAMTDGSIAMNKAELSLTVGQSEQLSVVGFVQGDSIESWTSSDEAVASVSKDGLVTGIQAGQVVITASAGNLQVVCTVTVLPNGKIRPQAGDNSNSHHNHKHNTKPTPTPTPVNIKNEVQVNTNSKTATVTTKPNTAPVSSNGTTTITTAVDSSMNIDAVNTVNIVLPNIEIKTAVKTENVVMQVKLPAAIAGSSDNSKKVIINATADVLKMAAQSGKKISINVINTDTGKLAYTCTIDGSTLNKATITKDINITMSVKTLDSDANISKAAQSKSGLVLSFSHSGSLPGPATFKIPAGNYASGTSLYLYYYNKLGMLEPVNQTCTVDANGNTAVTIAYCSQYVLLSQKTANTLALDTVKPYTFGAGDQYTFLVKSTSKTVPTATISDSSIATVKYLKKVPNGYLFQIIGLKDGATSVCATQDGKIGAFQINVKSGTVKSDTINPFSIKNGKSYVFKFTMQNGAKEPPVFFVGTPNTFSAEILKKNGNDYYFKITATGKPGTGAGIYTQFPGQAAVRQCVVNIG